MTDRWEFAARLAALHDREPAERDDVDDAESEAVRQELASADDDVLAAYADAVAIAREHREEDAVAGTVPPDVKSEPTVPGATPVTPLRPPESARGWRRAPARWLALAAVLAAVALVPLLRRAGSSPADAGRFAMLLDARDAGLPAGWTERSPFSNTRGEGTVATDTALAVRLGALLLDLELAARARDGESTAQLAATAVKRLESVPGSAPVAAVYGEIERTAGAPPEELQELLKDGREGIESFFDEGLVELGSWNEAARLAAFRRDGGFFASRETRNILERLDSPSLAPPARAAAARVRATLPAGGEPQWPTLVPALDELMRELAR